MGQENVTGLKRREGERDKISKGKNEGMEVWRRMNECVSWTTCQKEGVEV